MGRNRLFDILFYNRFLVKIASGAVVF